jgi:CDGSH-type Zn-finger protein
MTQPADTESTAHVRVLPNGPYQVSGGLPVLRRRIVYSEHDEPETWQTVAQLQAPARFALCRCGGSANKPFCDGTHTRNGFDGTEHAPTTTYDERQQSYPAPGIVMRDDRSICVHAGFCGNRVTDVWRMVRHLTDSTQRIQLMSMIEHCPSGALSYRLEADGPDVEPEFRTAVGVVEDGPLALTGGVTVERTDGTLLERRRRVTLCRCGHSANKPLCDGTHRNVGFRDA